MNHSQCVTTALDDLCRRAGVSPTDGSDEAGDRVWDVLEREVKWDSDGRVVNCPLNTWLCAVTGLEHAVVTHNSVYVHRVCHVPLSPAMVAAVKAYDTKRRGIRRAAA
ncbi:hypothetical protein VT84_13820 [Gemmata sp. SH-PL17]|uniref:hypothetical protein n=1 Tax=Gemmata sp. SH-PL17 TaxID=1630693 RepID=UPI00078EDA8F|nr:hypothetical protein [Gemmata sp. SH-PL17]AMV25471.1 hypothetical protein VT84_13820 [Gemmata sp. SH-PL17]